MQLQSLYRIFLCSFFIAGQVFFRVYSVELENRFEKGDTGPATVIQNKELVDVDDTENSEIDIKVIHRGGLTALPDTQGPIKIPSLFIDENPEFDLASQEAGIVIPDGQNKSGTPIGPDAKSAANYAQEAIIFNWGNLTGKLQIKFKPESFIGRNINLLNNFNTADFIGFSRSTIDLNLALDYGKKCYGFNVANFFVTMRNKSVWGNPESVARTTLTRVKRLEVVDDGHYHALTRQIMWIRELWFNFNVNEALNLHFDSKIYFMLGAFPFELGRGIVLGSAYAVNPGLLGFFSDNSIDQYAFGYKINADIVPNKLSLDLYGAFLQNRGDSLGVTGLKIYGQQFGRLLTPERGPGHVDYVIAARLKWFPYKSDCSSIFFEPYILYNNNPEQTLEFLADARIELGTGGLAGEFVIKNFEWGFDTAFNFGQQHVLGWDRNVIADENGVGVERAGRVTIVNSRVSMNSPTGPKVVYAPTDPNGRLIQNVINNSARDASQNGLQIGGEIPLVNPQTLEPITLFNDINRFRNPYSNKLKGWMLVADGAYWFFDRSLRFAVGVGVASGDEDPNKDLLNPGDSNVDGDFKGFIGLQEIYTGNRIQSVFLLGGAGRIPRPLTTPAQASNVLVTVPTVISGFTNLVFTGGSLLWTPKCAPKALNVRPNILAYWQQHATKKFDIFTKMSSPDYARNYLGTEINCFFDVEMLCALKLFAVGSIFIPGVHFTDIKGTPLNRDQQRILDRLDVSGEDIAPIPLLGDDVAYTINVGLEYRF